MSTQITTQKILAFDEYADFGALPGIEGYIYIDKAEAEAYLWDSAATPPVYVRIGEDTPIPPDPAPLTFVDAATVGILSFLPNYDNGPLNDGVGATLTATQVGMLRDTSGTGKIDSSYTPVAGGIVLVKNQVDKKQNGIYVITTVGSPNPGGTFYVLTRVVDFDQSAELFPLQVNVLQGTANANLYFNQAINPVNVGVSDIVFNPASYVSPSGVIAFVDVATTTALPNCTYANGTTNPSFPGLNATLTADAPGSVLTVDGLTASTSNVPLLTFTRVLVKNQANKAHNGDYIVVNPGSATARWQLRRINYGASGFYRFSRYFLVSNTQASLAGRIYITKQQDPALTNLGIGTQNIDLVEYGGGLPPWVETNATDLTIWSNGKGNISSNTSYGDEALKSNTTGSSNTAIGNTALRNVTTGILNTAIGANTLQIITTSSGNTAIGATCLSIVGGPTSSNNTAIGSQCLSNLSSGSSNISIGAFALQLGNSFSSCVAIGTETLRNNTVSNNVGIGHQSLTVNTTGNNNTAIGSQTLNANTTGSSNIAVGISSLVSNTIGSFNTAFGRQALQNNTNGNYNIALGMQTLNANVSGSQNTAIGFQSLLLATSSGNISIGNYTSSALTTGTNNTVLGYSAGQGLTTGSSNVIIGISSGQASNMTGSSNVFIGQGANTLDATSSGSVVLGASARSTASNQFVVGSSSTNAGSVTSETNTSSMVWNVIINGVARKILLA